MTRRTEGRSRFRTTWSRCRRSGSRSASTTTPRWASSRARACGSRRRPPSSGPGRTSAASVSCRSSSPTTTTTASRTTPQRPGRSNSRRSRRSSTRATWSNTSGSWNREQLFEPWEIVEGVELPVGVYSFGMHAVSAQDVGRPTAVGRGRIRHGLLLLGHAAVVQRRTHVEKGPAPHGLVRAGAELALAQGRRLQHEPGDVPARLRVSRRSSRSRTSCSTTASRGTSGSRAAFGGS